MASVIFDKTRIQNLIRKAVFEDERPFNEMGKEAANFFRSNARAGKRFDGKRFPNLKETTIDQRERLEDYGNRTSSLYRSTRSNLTFSGQLLTSLTHETGRPSFFKRRVKLLFKGFHRRYRGRNGLIGTVTENQTIYDGLVDKGYIVLGPNRTVKRITSAILKRYILRNVRNIFGR